MQGGVGMTWHCLLECQGVQILTAQIHKRIFKLRHCRALMRSNNPHSMPFSGMDSKSFLLTVKSVNLQTFGQGSLYMPPKI